MSIDLARSLKPEDVVHKSNRRNGQGSVRSKRELGRSETTENSKVRQQRQEQAGCFPRLVTQVAEALVVDEEPFSVRRTAKHAPPPRPDLFQRRLSRLDPQNLNIISRGLLDA